MGKPAWLRCKIHRGMFSTEFAVMVETKEGMILTFFVPEEFLQFQRKPSGSEEVEGQIRVHVLDENSGVINLPREPFEGSRFIRVARNVLAFA